MRDRITEFVRMLSQHNPAVCGDVPTRIADDIAEQFSALIASDISDEELGSKMQALAMGAVRYVADQCGSEGETLLAELDSLMK